MMSAGPLLSLSFCVVSVQTSMGNATINTIKNFAATTATRNGIMRGEKRFDVIIAIRQCVQVARGTGAVVTTFKAGEKAIINFLNPIPQILMNLNFIDPPTRVLNYF